MAKRQSSKNRGKQLRTSLRSGSARRRAKKQRRSRSQQDGYPLDPETIQELPYHLRGFPNNKWGGHKTVSLSPGRLWNPPDKPYPVRISTPEEIDAINAANKLVAQPIYIGVGGSCNCARQDCSSCQATNYIFVD